MNNETIIFSGIFFFYGADISGSSGYIEISEKKTVRTLHLHDHSNDYRLCVPQG